MNFPESREACLELANEIVLHLNDFFGQTKTRPGWTTRNILAMEAYASRNGLHTYYSPKLGGRGEYLYDWSAFLPGQGLLIACESEWQRDEKNSHGGLKDDAAKLLFSSCPVKVFLCWVKDVFSAESIRKEFNSNFSNDYSRFQPGSVFILYCIHAESLDGANKDRVWLFQAGGKFQITAEPFNLISYEAPAAK